MIGALHAEWTKLRTTPGTAWILLGTVVLTAGLSALVSGTVHIGGGGQDPTKLSLSGVYLGQAVVVVLGVLAISEEYGTGMIRTTLAAIPRRRTLLVTKAVWVAAASAAAGLLGIGGSLVAGRLLLTQAGAISFGHAATLRAGFGSVIYLVLIGILALGVATAIRDTAVSIGFVLALLYLIPILAAVVEGPSRRHLEQLAPMTAGLAIQATTNLSSLPISPWAGLGVLAAWSAGALIIGGCVLRLRNA